MIPFLVAVHRVTLKTQLHILHLELFQLAPVFNYVCKSNRWDLGASHAVFLVKRFSFDPGAKTKRGTDITHLHKMTCV